MSVMGPETPVNVGALDARDISAHNSPTLVRNPARPLNLAVSSRIDTPFFSCGLHVSQDAGRTWSQTPVPAPEGEEAKCFAPDVAFAADGTLYLAFVTLEGPGNVPSATWLSKSTDGGGSFTTPLRVSGPLGFQVRLAPDPREPQRLYMTWLQGEDVGTFRFTQTGNPIVAVRSDDAGASWSSPVRVSGAERERVVAGSPAVGPDGELYVLFLDLGDDALDYDGGHEGRGGPPYPGSFELVLGRSRDHGATWEESVVDDGLSAIHRFIVFTPVFPSLAVAPSGRVYAAFHDDRSGDPDVWVWSLSPGSSDWGEPVRVNDTEEGDGTWQYLPKVAVAPDGRLDVVYYDRRLDPENLMNGVSLQSSFDAGSSFTPAVSLTSRTFDSRIGYLAKEGLPDLGSRLGLLSDDARAIGLWTDTRGGTPGTQKQDLAAAQVAFARPSRFTAAEKDGLRYGGLGLAGVGLLLLAVGFKGRNARRSGSALPD
ncbi:MAG: sialidase family protein [Solirubrobacteraceae bacterium]